MRKNKNILITGAAGFIGANLCQKLIEKGYNVFGISLSGKKINLRRGTLNKKNFHFKKGNILNTKLISKIIKYNKIDTIIHLAAVLPSKKDIDNPLFIFKVNAQGTLLLLKEAFKNKVNKFIYTSTMSVYSEPPEYLPLDEDHPTKPLTIYGASKLSGELYCNVYSKFINITILRYGGAYGGGQHKHSAVYRFVKQAVKNKPITIYGSGNQSTDFTYIDDIINGTILAMGKNRPGVYNIGSGKETSIRHLAEKIIKLTKSKSKIIFLSKKTDRPFRFILDIDKARKTFGYSPTTLENGLSKYIYFNKKIF